MTANQTEILPDDLLGEILFAITLILSLVVCTANSLTIVVIWRTTTLRTLANLYVVSLASVDLLVGLFLVPLSLFILPSSRVRLYYRHIYLCVFINSFNVGMIANSLAHLTVISVDRYLYIVKPYLYQRLVSFRSVLCCIAVAWVVGLCYMIPPYFVFRNSPSASYCDATQLLPRWYLFYFTWTGYFTSACIILTMFIIVLRTAYKHQRRIHAWKVASSRVRDTGKQHSRSTYKSFKLFLTMFGAFFVCITPVVLCSGLDYVTRSPPWLYRCLIVLALFNSGMNFLVLILQNRQFRHQLWTLCKSLGSGHCLYPRKATIGSVC
ncbi:G-protein coupled receptor No9 [Biomphalaria glabrata]|nr:putative G-protein coupled receptor No9 [Biomphalaria glabrata]